MTGNQNNASSVSLRADAGEWLRKQRKYWQITQTELAEQSGIADASVIEEIEQGRIALPAFMRDAIAMAFSISRTDMAGICEEWYGQETAKAA